MRNAPGEVNEYIVETYIEPFLRILSVHDATTAAHCERVGSLSVAVAQEMGISVTQRTHVHQAALLHDIGKVGVPEHILTKPARLSPEELTRVRKHPEYAEYILQAVPLLAHLQKIIRHIHEHWDGSGKPDGLAGIEIPIETRIIAVANAYDSLTTSRSDRRARSPETALDVLATEAGAEWDPDVVQALIAVVKRGDIAEDVS